MQGLFVEWQQSTLDKLSVVVLSEKRELTDGVSITTYSNAWKNNGDKQSRYRPGMAQSVPGS